MSLDTKLLVSVDCAKCGMAMQNESVLARRKRVITFYVREKGKKRRKKVSFLARR